MILLIVIGAGRGDLDYVFMTTYALGIPALFWFPASITAFCVAFKIRKEKEKKNLKNALLAFPIASFALLLFFGEYQGP